MNALQQLFRDQLMDDDRIPAFAFTLFNHHVDFLAPNPLFFVQIMTILTLQILAGCCLSVVMYYGIVLVSSKDDRNRLPGYLVGYGLIIPASLMLPFWLLETLDLRNVGYRMGLVCLPLTVTLRCLESMYGFVGEHERSSLWQYVAGSAFIAKPCRDHDQRLVPLSMRTFTMDFQYHVKWLLCVALLFHVFAPYQWCPFPSSVPADQVWVSFDVGHLYNTFLQAFLINATLAMSVSGCGVLASVLSGVSFDGVITDHPMFLSTSPSDFWGRRWNNLIHIGLKQGVYKPMRWNTGNHTLASVTAFVVSGLYHELVWKILFTPTTNQLAAGMMADDQNCCRSCYCHGWPGKQMIFFGWNGVLIALEYLIGDQVVHIMRPLPRWLRNHLVVMLSLPVGHLFTADLTMSGYFDSIRQALPLFVVTKL
jgi:hypothetical protein